MRDGDHPLPRPHPRLDPALGIYNNGHKLVTSQEISNFTTCYEHGIVLFYLFKYNVNNIIIHVYLTCYVNMFM